MENLKVNEQVVSDEAVLRDNWKRFVMKFVPPESRMIIDYMFNTSGEDDVIQLLNDEEIADTVCGELSDNNGNAEEEEED